MSEEAWSQLSEGQRLGVLQQIGAELAVKWADGTESFIGLATRRTEPDNG